MLTLTLPASLSAVSGINAIAHAVEGLYAEGVSPIFSIMAEEAIRALNLSLRIIIGDPADLVARTEALYGAWLAGTVLGSVGMALHHKLCHTLGGTFNLPHAETHAVVLPYVASYNAADAPEAMSRVARALGADNAALGLYELARAVRAPSGLRVLGMRQEQLDGAADLATSQPYANPRSFDRTSIRTLLQAAYDGGAPT